VEGVSGAILGLLQNRNSAQRLDDRGNLFRLVTYYDNRFARFERFAGANNMLYQRATPSLVEDFGQARLQASALSRSEDNYS